MINEIVGPKLGLKHCSHGLILYRTNDMYLGRSIDLYGEFSIGEIDIFKKYVDPELFAIDVGSNIGIHTIELSRLAKAVVSIEMEPQLFQMTCANIALNNRYNVVTVNAAVGSYDGKLIVPRIDFSDDGNFGCMSAKGHKAGDPVKLITIDSLQMSNCGFIKIDIEGMEREAIEGARYTIKRFKPVLYVENDRRENSAELIEYIMRLGYHCHWHFPPLFRADNWAKNEDNVFGGIASLNMICFPDDRDFEGGVRIDKPTSWWEELTVVLSDGRKYAE